MGGGVDGAAGVVGVDDDQPGGVGIGQGAELGQVHLPATPGLQVVVPGLDAGELAGGLVRGEARPREEQVAAGARQHRQADLDGLRPSHRQVHAILPDAMLHSLRQEFRHRPAYRFQEEEEGKMP